MVAAAASALLGLGLAGRRRKEDERSLIGRLFDNYQMINPIFKA